VPETRHGPGMRRQELRLTPEVLAPLRGAQARRDCVAALDPHRSSLRARRVGRCRPTGSLRSAPCRRGRRGIRRRAVAGAVAAGPPPGTGRQPHPHCRQPRLDDDHGRRHHLDHGRWRWHVSDGRHRCPAVTCRRRRFVSTVRPGDRPPVLPGCPDAEGPWRPTLHIRRSPGPVHDCR
jgi:hypothetical protein